jgi:hypothetical protein
MGLFARPVLCGGLSALATGAVYKLVYGMFEHPDTRASAFIILMASGITLVLTYCATVLIFRAIKENEVRLLPKGNFIADKLMAIGWLKGENE